MVMSEIGVCFSEVFVRWAGLMNGENGEKCGKISGSIDSRLKPLLLIRRLSKKNEVQQGPY